MDAKCFMWLLNACGEHRRQLLHDLLRRAAAAAATAALGGALCLARGHARLLGLRLCPRLLLQLAEVSKGRRLLQHHLVEAGAREVRDQALASLLLCPAPNLGTAPSCIRASFLLRALLHIEEGRHLAQGPEEMLLLCRTLST